MKAWQNIAVAFILALMLLAGISGSRDFAKRWPLAGAYHQSTFPQWSLEDWLKGHWQAGVNQAFEEQIGFRPLLVRLRNQLHYWLYRRSTHRSIIVGKDQQVLPLDFHMAYRGETWVGMDSLRRQLRAMQGLDSVMRHWGKPLLLTIAPSKIWLMPDKLPRGYSLDPCPSTNYLLMKELLDSAGINTLDLNRYFMAVEDTAGVPLFANTGVHWNAYGMALGLERIIERLEELSDRDLVNPRVEGYTLGEQLHPDDGDLGDLMNLLLPIETEPQPWPLFSSQQQPAAQPARVLLIADSFFFGLTKLPDTWHYLDYDTRFWYYGNTQYDPYLISTPTSGLSAVVAVQNADFVVFISNTSNMGRFTFGFPQKFLRELKEK